MTHTDKSFGGRQFLSVKGFVRLKTLRTTALYYKSLHMSQVVAVGQTVS